MEIPERFRGTWRVKFEDTTVASYDGEITVDAESVTAIYDMHKTRGSSPTIVSVSESRLVLHEICDSFKVHIVLGLDPHGQLIGVWKPAKSLSDRLRASAVLTRDPM